MPSITITTLGSNGRLANSLFQYVTGKALANKFACKLEIPSNWWGRSVFEIKDYDLTHKPQATTPIDYIPTEQDMAQFNVVDLLGYWQFQDALNLYSLKDAMFWLKPKKHVMQVVKDYVATLTDSSPFIAVHKRRGDYVNQYIDKYAVVSDASFEKGIRQAKDYLAMNMGIIDPVVLELTEENPAPTIDGVPGWIIDFFIMSQAAAVVRSNSTFSWWGGLYCINNGGVVFAPVVNDRVGWCDVDFIQGNWPRCADSKNHTGSKLTDLHLRMV